MHNSPSSWSIAWLIYASKNPKGKPWGIEGRTADCIMIEWPDYSRSSIRTTSLAGHNAFISELGHWSHRERNDPKQIERNFTLVIVRTAAWAADASCSGDEAAPATSVFVSSTSAFAVFRIASRWSANVSPSCSESSLFEAANRMVVS